MIAETSLAWFSGLFEGEGSILCKSRSKRGGAYPSMSIGSTDLDVLEKAKSIVGGNVKGPYARKTPRGTAGKSMWFWTLTKTEKVIELATQMRPYLGSRRQEQIDEALTAQKWADPIPPMEVRFWDYVQKTDKCWVWTGAIDKYGFGTWGYTANKRVQAHRFALGMVGKLPSRVVNTCGTKSCVRPEHWQPAKKAI